jgi:hypothetical protein
MMSDSDIPSEIDEHLMGTNGKPDLRTICGYCTQGRHSECREDTCNCAKNNHEVITSTSVDL